MKTIPPLLIGAVVVGATLRAIQAGESLWVDELHTSWAVSGSLTEVAERAAIGNQSPLYFWLAWFSSRLPIMPEIALRLPSLIAGCCLPVAMYWLTRKLLPVSAPQKKVGAPLLAAWLAALDPLGIFYAQEARPYAILQLVVVLHIGALLDLFVSRNWRRHAWWIISGALLVHLHYTAGLVLVAEAVAVVMYFAYFARRGTLQRTTTSRYVRRFGRLFAVDFVLLGMLLLPALPAMLEVGSRRANWNEFVSPHPPLFDVLLVYRWTIAGLFLWFVQWKGRAFETRKVTVLLCWLFLPQIIAWLATTTGLAPLFFSRYLLSSWPASLVAAALFWHALHTPVLQRLFAAVVVVFQIQMGGMWLNWYQDGRLLHDRNEDWRAAARTLESAIQSSPRSAVLLVRAGLIEADELRRSDDPLLREYCLLPVRGMYRIETRRDDEYYPLPYNDPGRLTSELRERLLRAKEVLILNRSSDPLADLQASLGSEVSLYMEEEPAEFGGVYLQRIMLKPTASPR